MSQTILIVGAGYKQLPLIRAAMGRGFRVIAVDGNPDAPGLAMAHEAHPISTRDVSGLVALAREAEVDAVSSLITESSLPAVRAVAQGLELPAPSERGVRATVDKGWMRKLLERAGLENPRYAVVCSLQEARRAATRIGFPLVIKPADLGGQVGLSRADSMAELGSSFKPAIGASISGEVILEEHLDGEEINVVAIIWGGHPGRWIASDRRRFSGRAFGIVCRHVYPAQFAKGEVRRLEALLERITEAFEVEQGILFLQILRARGSLFVVDFGERVPGGMMNELFSSATGIDLTQFHLDTALGKQAEALDEWQISQASAAATVKFLAGPPGGLRVGRVAAIHGEDDALKIPRVIAVGLYHGPEPSLHVPPLRVGRDRFYFIHAVGRTRDEAILASKRAEAIIRVTVEDPAYRQAQ